MGARQKHLRFCLLLCSWEMMGAHLVCINLKVPPILNKVRISIQCYECISTMGKKVYLNIALFYQNSWIKLYNTWVSCPLTTRNKTNSFAKTNCLLSQPYWQRLGKAPRNQPFPIYLFITLLYLLMPFLSKHFPALLVGEQAARFVLSAPNTPYLHQPCINAAMATLLLHFNLASSLS